MSEHSENPAASNEASEAPRFSDLGLPPTILAAVEDGGYTHPTPIQAAVIPSMLEGRDVVGLAQTGTGKTAGFALPALANIDTRERHPQFLVLAPTRELANQVAEACMKYGRGLGLIVASCYGGAGYGEQLRSLRRGAQLVVGTPGRIMDHIERGSLNLENLHGLVLDEADEMLRMGFIEDVEWILERLPEQRQLALFSATMPPQINRIAKRYLNDPVEVRIKAKTATAENIRQRYWLVRGQAKPKALARIIEAENSDGIMVFARTKVATVEVARALEQEGIKAAALNGDLAQSQREQIVDSLKEGKLDVVVATDVAARGLDVSRISHVINYDLPGDSETYVHRIGRTGRAGRSGDAILFLHPRERRHLRNLERHTRQHIEEMDLPSVDLINELRAKRFAEEVVAAVKADGNELYTQVLNTICDEHSIDPLEAAAALAKMARGARPLFLSEEPDHRHHRPERGNSGEHGKRHERERHFDDRQYKQHDHQDGEYYCLQVGRTHGTRPNMIVGAIANELGIPGKLINAIRIHQTTTTLSLPANLPAQVVEHLRRIYVAGRPLEAERMDHVPEDTGNGGRGGRPRKGGGKFHKKSRGSFGSGGGGGSFGGGGGSFGKSKPKRRFR